MNRGTKTALGVCVALAVGACSVPKEALDSAALGSQTAMKTAKQLQNLQEAQAAAAQRREQRLQDLRDQQAKSNSVERQHIDVAKAAGAGASLRLSASITALAASEADFAQKIEPASVAASSPSEMLTPIAKAATGLTTVSNDLVPLSKQRTTQERLNIALSFAKSVRAQVDAASAAQGAASVAAATAAQGLSK